MLSHPLGVIDLDEARLAPEVEFLLQCNTPNQSYSEFIFGNWRTLVLWNTSGKDQDGLVAVTQGTVVPVPRAHGLTYINDLITRNFHLDNLKLVRSHILEDGVLIPHRDFVELDGARKRWCRVHLPLLTNEGCLHSEEQSVFRMRRGEVWFLNAAHTHSACNLGQNPRLSLCLDFDLGEQSISSIFRDVTMLRPTMSVQVEREPIDDNFLTAISGLSQMLNRSNYREILNLLARIHFYKNVDINDFYVWIVEIARQANDSFLLEKFSKFALFLRTSRAMDERFVL